MVGFLIHIWFDAVFGMDMNQFEFFRFVQDVSNYGLVFDHERFVGIEITNSLYDA